MGLATTKRHGINGEIIKNVLLYKVYSNLP